jgi:hypothetical protein
VCIPQNGEPVKFIVFLVTRSSGLVWPIFEASRLDRPEILSLWKRRFQEVPDVRVDQRAGRMRRQWLTAIKSPIFSPVDKRKDSRPWCVDGPLGL